jgi:hypothetical protein
MLEKRNAFGILVSNKMEESSRGRPGVYEPIIVQDLNK